MIELYNTLTKKKEEFKPINSNIVKIYSCGPTVYSRQHIGNLRAAIFIDTLKRILRYANYQLEDVTNITDVGHLVSDDDEGEDKMLKAAKIEKKDPFEIAKFYEKLYIQDLGKLNVILPKHLPRATENIKEQLEIIEELEKGNYIYKTSDGIYFDVSKFKDYGKLSGQSLEEKQVGARVEVDTEKRNPQDFALWKFLTGDNEKHIMKWDSKFGEGFPGWHIECSAMSSKYLGDKIDIHTGGVDHIPVHHENEIAQNTCSGAVKQINFWMHNAHLKIENEKMSKSLGNVYNVDTIIEKGFNPLAFRETCLRTHYRKEMNFTFESLKAGETNVEKINKFFTKLKMLKSESEEEQTKNIYEENMQKFENAIFDDLNTTIALSAVYEFMTEFNKIKEYSKNDLKLAKIFMQKTDKVLGLIKDDEEIPLEVLELAKERVKVRVNKNFEESDKLRDEIEELGYEIKDDKNSRAGFILTKIKNV
ncbi:MAG: cysteine--tRNA ligase [Candidatus Woesearchaeota archaeon]|jgi:cysteinyl-tRNA synthetase|nr:cysteine--tRNA ligase [Candidatus Woesearchaeota archaeon]